MRWLSPPDSVPDGAVEVEIVEPDIVEEAEPLVDLLEDRPRDLVLLSGQLRVERREPCQRVGDRAAGCLADMLAGDLHRQRLGPQPRAVAGLARAADWYLLSSSRIHALSVCSIRRCRLPITPSNALFTS